MSIIRSLQHLAFCLLLLLPLGIRAMENSAPQPDSLFSEQTDVRHISKNMLQELKADGDMNYHLASPDDNWLLMFRDWLFTQIFRLFGTEGAAGILEIIVYTLCIGVLVYATLRILNVDISGLFRRGNRKTVLAGEGTDPQENIHEIDFNTALTAALKAGEYNKAVRLLYLSSLKSLSEGEYIYWRAGKTNYQYQQELAAAPLQEPFHQLGFYFEYAWYGNFIMSEHHYKEAERLHQSLNQHLQQKT